MRILSNNSKELIIGMLATYENLTGIFKEIKTTEVPKNILKTLDPQHGSGVYAENYFRSNTYGLTSGKYFKKIADRVKFRVKNHDELEKLNNVTDLTEGINILENNLRNDLEFRIGECVNMKDAIHFDFDLVFNNNDYAVLKHELESHENFKKFKEYFIGRDTTTISFRLEIDKKDIEIVTNLNKKRGEFTKSEIKKFIMSVSILKQYWYFSIDENRYFYGNKNDMDLN